jgi:ABC-2 type transport system permease protein
MNVGLQLKCLNLKGIGWDVILPYIKNGIFYALIWFPIGIGLYSGRIALYKYKFNSKNNRITELKEAEEEESFEEEIS